MATTDFVQPCINTSVTFVCTVQAQGFQWTVGSLLTGNDGLVAVGVGGALNTITTGMFTLTAEGASAPNFRSTLQVIVSPELNGSMVRCANNLNTNISEEVLLAIHSKLLHWRLFDNYLKSTN